MAHLLAHVLSSTLRPRLLMLLHQLLLLLHWLLLLLLQAGCWLCAPGEAAAKVAARTARAASIAASDAGANVTTAGDALPVGLC